jgi:hypothetical protein
VTEISWRLPTITLSLSMRILVFIDLVVSCSEKSSQKPVDMGTWKPNGFQENGNQTVFKKMEQFSLFPHDFNTILHFDKFCRTHCFKFLIWILTKILK